MVSNQLITTLNFKQIFFRKKRFDKKFLNDAIDHLAGYLASNIQSSSPFILMATYSHIKSRDSLLCHTESRQDPGHYGSRK